MKWETVAALIREARLDNTEKFRAHALQLIAHERAGKRYSAADGLQRALETQPPAVRMVRLAEVAAPPFVRVSTPAADFDALVLASSCRADLDAVLNEHARKDELTAHGLAPSRRLLLHGPPGNGKTKTAEALARRLGMPFYYVSIAGLVNSYLGATSANMLLAFEFAGRHPGVLFFDEFDAVAKNRVDGNDVGETRRIVNSVLQILDTVPSDGMLIAATNADSLIDPAVWRRFDLAIPFQNPDIAMAQTYIDRALVGFTLADGAWESGRDNPARTAVDKLSMSWLERAIMLAKKTAVLAGTTTITRSQLCVAMERCADRSDG